MSPEQLFSMCNFLAIAGWVLLLAAPRSSRATAVASTIIPLCLSAIYVGVVAFHWRESNGNFSSLQGVSALFANPWILLAGWVHYLAFDLFVGGWEVRDAVARGVSRWLVAPCLLLTFLFGPAGWIAYYAVRASARPAS